MKLSFYSLCVRFVVALCALLLLIALAIVVRGFISWDWDSGTLIIVRSLTFICIGALPLIPAYFLYRGKAWARWFFSIAALFGVIAALLPFVGAVRNTFFFLNFPAVVLSIVRGVAGVSLFRALEYDQTYIAIVNASVLAINAFIVGGLVDWKAVRARAGATQSMTHAAPHDKHARWARLSAYMIDHLLMAFAILVGFSFVGRSAEFDTFLIRVSIAIALVLIVQIVLIARRSQTVGKYLMDLQVVDVRTGARISAPRYILIRGFVGSWLFGFALLPIVSLYRLIDILYIFKDDERTLHDRIADTKVVRLL